MSGHVLLPGLLRPDCYDHPADDITVIETHISLIFLAGDYAYKLKKPLNLGFLDFSTLDQRLFFCREEVRLNRAFAPELYLDVVAVGGRRDAPVIGGRPVLDYLVKMVRFAQDQQLDVLLNRQELNPEHMRAFASRIAQAHREAAVADRAQGFGSFRSVMAPVLENFLQIGDCLPPGKYQEFLVPIEHWSRDKGVGLERVFSERREQGFIRECHGDIHLRNMAWIENSPVLFDCIEFSPELRWIDTVNDIAFLLMDLDDRGESGLAWNFLDAYLQESGDFSGLRLLRFYQVYRAMVRAKVTALQLAQVGNDPDQHLNLSRLLISYLELAASYLVTDSRRLILTYGLSGTGKSTFATALAPRIRAVCLHSDRERKREYQYSLNEIDSSGDDLYSEKSRADIYLKLEQVADQLLASGLNVIVDATFLDRDARKRMLTLARNRQAVPSILHFDVAEDIVLARLKRRTTHPDRFSDADEGVYAYQLKHHHPLSDEEHDLTIRVTPETTVSEVASRLES